MEGSEAWLETSTAHKEDDRRCPSTISSPVHRAHFSEYLVVGDGKKVCELKEADRAGAGQSLTDGHTNNR